MKRENWRRIKQTVCAIAGGVVLVGGVFFVYHWSRDKEHRDMATRIAEYGPRKGVPRTIEDLQRAIAAYEDLQELHVKDAAQTATYWKILSIRFQDKGMFLEAVKALRRAIELKPDDETLHYLTALNAAQSAKSMFDYEEGSGGIGTASRRYLNLAEAAYLRAIEIEGSYTQARYGLAVLYVFELERPADAVPQLRRYMENRSGDADAMFLMARALYMTGEYEEALDWYERGIPLTKDAARKAEAESNRNYIRGLL
ncbi:MAG: tetratricopeptide repeat protein [Spirochaetaceae bacterium]|jgi:tetratricopeptide (TPR) repeat protein|nr:tetratricopeptide repeat protein [Spirochaetaceae bacterium]